jgi:hypothetical protein
MWVFSAKLASHLLSGTQNFGIDPRLVENWCTCGVNVYFERKTTFYDTSLVLTTDELIVLMSALLND